MAALMADQKADQRVAHWVHSWDNWKADQRTGWRDQKWVFQMA
jgi:hypothetical protein